MNPSFFHLTLESVPEAQEEQVSSLCFEWKATGVAQNLDFTQPHYEYQPEIVPNAKVDLDVYFDTFPGDDFFARFQAAFPDIRYRFEEEPNRDWLAEWKKSFQPFCLAGPYWVVPSWCPIPTEAKVPLLIDPGMAFGTGTHATTQMCARLLVEHLKPARTLIDVGTGTGILAMLAQHLQASQIRATDSDPQALEVALENFMKNGASHIELSNGALSKVPGPYDFVVANIVDGVLLKLKPELLRLSNPERGKLILSGILKEREHEFARAFLEGTKLRVAARLEQDEWVGLLLQ